jgi:hypothetical protein
LNHEDHTKPFIDFFLTKSNPFAATHTDSHRNSRKLFAEIEPFNGLPPSAASHLSYLFVHCSLNRKVNLTLYLLFLTLTIGWVSLNLTLGFVIEDL